MEHQLDNSLKLVFSTIQVSQLVTEIKIGDHSYLIVEWFWA